MTEVTAQLSLVTAEYQPQTSIQQSDPFEAITDPRYFAIMHVLEADGSKQGALAAHAYGSFVLMATSPNALTELEQRRFPRLLSALVIEHNDYIADVLRATGMREQFKDAFNIVFGLLEDKLAAVAEAS